MPEKPQLLGLHDQGNATRPPYNTGTYGVHSLEAISDTIKGVKLSDLSSGVSGC